MPLDRETKRIRRLVGQVIKSALPPQDADYASRVDRILAETPSTVEGILEHARMLEHKDADFFRRAEERKHLYEQEAREAHKAQFTDASSTPSDED